MKHKVTSLLILLILFPCPLNNAFGMAYNDHERLMMRYVGGISRNEVKTIHSEIIDKVPWWKGAGGGELHRKYWGHSKDWYYKGKVPNSAIRDVAKRKGVSYTRAQEIIRKEYFQGFKNGRELIANHIKRTFPVLNQKEVLALADQVHVSHTWGDDVNNLANQIRKNHPNITPSRALS